MVPVTNSLVSLRATTSTPRSVGSTARVTVTGLGYAPVSLSTVSFTAGAGGTQLSRGRKSSKTTWSSLIFSWASQPDPRL